MTLSGSKLISHLRLHLLIKPSLTKRSKIISLFRRLSFSIACSVVLFPANAVAQVTPDGSVPTTVEQLEEIMRINGGQQSGNNLFHSFEEFSIPEGMEAVFENSTEIENIFTRVTGNEVSNIDGILSTQGDANFYFINPNGIVFGDNASLNVGGSFIASTAESIQFEDGSEFSASDESQPILTVSFPVGLGLGSNPGAITVNGQGNQITPFAPESATSVEENTTGLSVDSGETLGLIGGNLNFNGGTITVSGGRIELGSVSSGSVSLTQAEQGLNFGFDNADVNRNISLNNLSLLDSSGEGRGAISLTGNNINVADGSHILIQNTGNISAEDISINAPGSLTLSGTADDGNVSSAISAEALSAGKGSNITISTSKLVLQNAASIRAVTFTDAIGGNVTIDATESVQLLENTFVNQNRTSALTNVIIAPTYGSGNGGNIQVSTSRLRILEGGYISSSTLETGRGGNITVSADEIKLEGIKLDRNQKLISYSVLSASSFDAGNAGNVYVSTAKLQILDGGQIASSSFASGNSGTVTVNASESIEVSGVSNDSPSSIRASADIPSSALKERYGLPDSPSGFSGNLRINTPILNVNSGGGISVRNEGTGDAGTFSIDADFIDLDNSGSITAASSSGNGGDINIDADSLQLDNDSQITAEASNEGDGGNITINTSNLSAKKKSNLSTSAVGGDGGNITIDADTILGLENSDITANAVGGNGGNININSDLIYGFQQRSQTTPFNDITASSELGIDGTVTINSPETSIDEDIIFALKQVDFNRYQKLLTGSCLDQNRPGREQFTYLGSGLPNTPKDFYQFDDPLLDEASMINIGQSPQSTPPPKKAEGNKTPPIWQPGDPIVQANAIQVNPNGRKFLVTDTNTPLGSSASSCNPEVQTQTASPLEPISVKQINFIGNQIFTERQLKEIATIKEGQTVTLSKLLQLPAQITNYYINQGYISSGAFIPAQELNNGVISVQIIEGTLDAVEIQGLSHLQTSYLKARLPIGKPLKQDTLLESLTKLKNNPLIAEVQAQLLKSSPQKSRLIVKVKEKKPFQTQFAVSNSFSPSIGTFGGEAKVDYHLLGLGDMLNLGYARTRKTGLIRYDVGYTLPINRYDGTFNLSYTDASTNIVEEPTSALDIQADFTSFGFTVKQPITLNKNEQLVAELALEKIQSETFIDEDFSYAFTEGLPNGESQTTALRLGTEYTNKGQTSSILLRSQFNLGLDLFDATVTDVGIDGLFWSWQGKVQWLKKLNRNDLILVSNLDLQLTPDQLLPIEQISLGGVNSVRGYRQNLSIGDNGVIANVELQIPIFSFLRFDDGIVKLNPFIDGGTIWNNQDESIESSTLLSMGLGLSLELAEILAARVDYGIPLIEAELPEDFDQGEKVTFSLVVTP